MTKIIKGIVVTSYLILFKIDSDACEHDKNEWIKKFNLHYMKNNF